MSTCKRILVTRDEGTDIYRIAIRTSPSEQVELQMDQTILDELVDKLIEVWAEFHGLTEPDEVPY